MLFRPPENYLSSETMIITSSLASLESFTDFHGFLKGFMAVSYFVQNQDFLSAYFYSF